MNIVYVSVKNASNNCRWLVSANVQATAVKSYAG